MLPGGGQERADPDTDAPRTAERQRRKIGGPVSFCRSSFTANYRARIAAATRDARA